MKIHELYGSRLRNDEHFQFHDAFCKIVTAAGAQNLKIEALFAAYIPLYEKEDEGIKRVSKSFLTAKIHDADKARDDTYSGMVEINNGSLKHYSEPVREAAGRLKILFDTYGNVSIKPLNEQTSAIHNILQELKGEYLQAAQTVGLQGWTAELETRNAAFDALMLERFDEAASKTDVVVRTARAELDAVYHKIVERINALVVIEGEEQYRQFIKTLNQVIAKYNAVVNARLGRKHHKHETGSNTENNEDNDGGGEGEQTEEEDS